MSQSLLFRYNTQAGGWCKKCGGPMEVGQALEEIMSGVPDFSGDGQVCTVGPSGWSRLVSCIKCSSCGFSITGQGEVK